MAKQPAPKPMPTTATSGRAVLTPITVFTNEANVKAPRLGKQSVNPGKPAGGK